MFLISCKFMGCKKDSYTGICPYSILLLISDLTTLLKRLEVVGEYQFTRGQELANLYR
jgi:hypothetical protein